MLRAADLRRPRLRTEISPLEALMAKRRRRKTVAIPGPPRAAASSRGRAGTVLPSPPASVRVRAFLLLASGFAALVYETLWVKQLGRVVGVEVHAVTIALSAFFAGLALGSALLGQLADRAVRPIRLYATLEAGVAVCGALATHLLARAAGPFLAFRDAAGP